MTDRKKALQEEVERMEREYQNAQAHPLPDKKLVDHIYKKLKKVRKELQELEDGKK